MQSTIDNPEKLGTNGYTRRRKKKRTHAIKRQKKTTKKTNKTQYVLATGIRTQTDTR